MKAGSSASAETIARLQESEYSIGVATASLATANLAKESAKCIDTQDGTVAGQTTLTQVYLQWAGPPKKLDIALVA